jgi:hypothetical protein
MEKFLKIIWSVNGVAIFLLLLVTGIIVLVEWLDNLNYRQPRPEVIVGQELEEAKAEGLILQGLVYESPLPIFHTDHYLLPVSVKTFDNPKRAAKKFGIGSSRDVAFTEEIDDVMNIVFLNSRLEPVSVLLDKKAFVQSFRYPSMEQYNYRSDGSDTLQRHITYLIAREDSNKDGALDDDDEADLYFSTLDGKDFARITEAVDVSDYSFLNANEILISYYKRDETAKEHRTKYFARFNIVEKKLEELDALHKTLHSLETQLTQ